MSDTQDYVITGVKCSKIRVGDTLYDSYGNTPVTVLDNALDEEVLEVKHTSGDTEYYDYSQDWLSYIPIRDSQTPLSVVNSERAEVHLPALLEAELWPTTYEGYQAKKWLGDIFKASQTT